MTRLEAQQERVRRLEALIVLLEQAKAAIEAAQTKELGGRR